MTDLEQNTNSNTEKFVILPANLIRPSSVLPKRAHGNEIKKSIKQMGVIQPLIVRAIRDSNNPGFELIDGHGRAEGLEPNELVSLKIVEAKDSEVFQISNATFQRKNRTANEIAEFYEGWLQVIVKEKETKEGAQAELAKKANRTEGLISQYLAIRQLFEKLKTLSPNIAFSALKIWDLNRLYQLTKLQYNPKLLEIALELENKPETHLEDLKSLVNNIQQAPMEPIISTDGSSPNAGQCEAAIAPDNMPKPTPKKLIDLLSKATKNLNEVTPKLNGLMHEIETDTEKYSSTQTLFTVKHVLRLLKKLQKYTEMLTQTTSSKSNCDHQTGEIK